MSTESPPADNGVPRHGRPGSPASADGASADGAHVDGAGEWLKLNEAARALEVSEITLRRKIKCGKLPHEFRNGKYFVYVARKAAAGFMTFPAPAIDLPAGSLSPSPALPPSPSAQVRLLQQELEKRESLIRDLRRAVEDQQTLIAFLEETIDRLAGTH